MALISKFIAFLFLATLSLSLQINARDSQFFSKVTHFNNNNVREVPQNEEPVNKPEQQPVFLPETENSYGLYGHESGLHPPTTTNTDPYTPTTTYKPYKTTTDLEDTNNKYSSNNYYDFQKENTNYPNEISDTRLTGTSYDTKFTGDQRYNSLENRNNNNNKYYYNNNAANEKYYFNNNAPSDRYSFRNKAAGNNYNGERLGMSDTRAMEGGKYFYDVNSEKYNPTTVNEDSSKGVNSENWYNNRGYFGNNNNNVNNNFMEGYQNQDEFENEQVEFEP